MITNLNMQTAENGYIVDYWKDGKAKKLVFHTWDALCTWMKEQLDTQTQAENKGK